MVRGRNGMVISVMPGIASGDAPLCRQDACVVLYLHILLSIIRRFHANVESAMECYDSTIRFMELRNV